MLNLKDRKDLVQGPDGPSQEKKLLSLGSGEGETGGRRHGSQSRVKI